MSPFSVFLRKIKSMKVSDFPIGTKVVPHSKSVGITDFTECGIWNVGKKQGFLYVIGHLGDDELYLSCHPESKSCNRYACSDVTIYEKDHSIKVEVKRNHLGFLEVSVPFFEIETQALNHESVDKAVLEAIEGWVLVKHGFVNEKGN